MNKRENELKTEKISKLLFKQSLPAIIGLVVMATYNIVDAMFVGWGVGKIGIAALGIVLPIQMVIMAFVQLIGIGGSSMISRGIGAADYGKVKNTLGNVFIYLILLSVIATTLCLIFQTPMLKLFGATSELLLISSDYMGIILIGTVFMVFTLGGTNIIRSMGSAKFAMVVMISSCLVNVILDSIFIFYFNMGISGAAYATVIAQLISTMCVFYYFLKGKDKVKIHLENLKLKKDIFKELFAVGASSFARQISSSVVVVILNHTLVFYGGIVAIAAFGIVNRILMFVVMPMVGIVQGMQPILGYNYGARENIRAREAVITSVKAATIFSIIAFFTILFFSRYIVGIFDNDLELIEMSNRAIKIIMIIFPIVGFQIVAGGVYQSLGKALPAFLMSLLRQVIILIPVILILPMYFGLEGIWYAYPIADIVGGIITFFMLKHEIGNFTNVDLQVLTDDVPSFDV